MFRHRITLASLLITICNLVAVELAGSYTIRIGGSVQPRGVRIWV